MVIIIDRFTNYSLAADTFGVIWKWMTAIIMILVSNHYK